MPEAVMRLLLTVLILAQAMPKPAERPPANAAEVRRNAERNRERKPLPRRVNYPRTMKF